MTSFRRLILIFMMALLPLQGYSAVMASACHLAQGGEHDCHEDEAVPQAAMHHDCHHQDHDATPEKHPAKSSSTCADSLCCHFSGAPAMALPTLPIFISGNAYQAHPAQAHPSHIPEQPQRPPLA